MSNITIRDSLQEYLAQLLRDYTLNRKSAQDKWNRNRDAFMAVVTGAWKKQEAQGWRSDTFIQLTRQKVLSAFSIVSDHLLSNGKFPFLLEVAPETEKDFDTLPPDKREEIESNIDDAEKIIQQQLIDSQSDKALAKCIMATAMLGTGFAKRNIETLSEQQFRSVVDSAEFDTSRLNPEDVQQASQVFEMVRREWDSPGIKHVSTWNIFWDMEEPDFDKCRGVFHCETVSPAWLMEQIGKEGYIRENILAVIRTNKNSTGKVDGRDANSEAPGVRELKTRHKNIKYAEYWGRVSLKVAEEFETWLIENNSNSADIMSISYAATNTETVDFDPEIREAQEVEIMCCLGDDKIVRYMRSDPQMRPIMKVDWELIVDENTGRGVADAVESMQKTINGAFRTMEDNKKLSGNVLLALKREFIENKLAEIIPGMIIELSAECDDARQAIQPIQIPDVGSQLNDVIQVCMRFAEEDSLIPRITQGFESSKSQTAYETAQQVEKATKYIATVVRNFDDYLIEPTIQWIYQWNMLDPEFQYKGDYVVKATGFSSYQDQIAAVAQIRNFMMFVMASPQLAPMLKARDALKTLAEKSSLDSALLIKSPDEMQLESQQRDPMLLANLEKIAAEIEKLRAEAASKLVGAETSGVKAEIDQARAAKEFEQTMLPPVLQQPSTPRPPRK